MSECFFCDGVCAHPEACTASELAKLCADNERLRAALLDETVIEAAERRIREQLQRIAALEAENEQLRAALTPSADTKSVYIGEFKFTVPDERQDEDDETVEFEREVLVPWTTVKEIMAAIRAYAENKTGSEMATKGVGKWLHAADPS